MKENIHEKLVCDFIIQFHQEKFSTSTIKFYSKPDKIDRKQKSVDYLYSYENSNLIAVEHTLIESYPDQIQDTHRFVQLLKPLEVELRDKLPKPGKYWLCIDINQANNTHGDYKKIRDLIKNWVVKSAPTLKVGSLKTAPHHMIREQPNDVPFFCTLYRREPINRNGYFYIARQTPDNIDQLRNIRIKKSLDDKTHKLAKAKKENNAESILILESNDFALSNVHLVRDSLENEIQKMPEEHIPDFIYLIETNHKPWFPYLLMKK